MVTMGVREGSFVALIGQEKVAKLKKGSIWHFIDKEWEDGGQTNNNWRRTA